MIDWSNIQLIIAPYYLMWLCVYDICPPPPHSHPHPPTQPPHPHPTPTPRPPPNPHPPPTPTPRACVVMIETTCPVKIFAQCVCWERFHPITPSVSNMWFLLFSTYMMYFLVFFFVMTSLIGNTIVTVLSYSVDSKPTQFPLVVHYLYMSCGASTKTIYGCWRLWSMGFKLLKKHNFISLSNTPIFIYTQCRTRENL